MEICSFVTGIFVDFLCIFIIKSATFKNHDTSLRTNIEMVRVLKWLNGSNDVEITSIPGGRIDETLDWSFNALRLFKNRGFFI